MAKTKYNNSKRCCKRTLNLAAIGKDSDKDYYMALKRRNKIWDRYHMVSTFLKVHNDNSKALTEHQSLSEKLNEADILLSVILVRWSVATLLTWHVPPHYVASFFIQMGGILCDPKLYNDPAISRKLEELRKKNPAECLEMVGNEFDELLDLVPDNKEG